MDDIRFVHKTVSKPNPVSRSVVIREEGRIVAHLAGLRVYRRTWMLHHLAGLPGKRAGLVVCVGALEHLLQDDRYEYLYSWFYAKAALPARVFGGYARRVPDLELSNLRQFAHFNLPVERRFDQTRRELEVGAADSRDLVMVERYFFEHEHPMVVRAEDLTRSGLSLEEIDDCFRGTGLRRRRRVLIARARGTAVGFALLEVSSIGLNLLDAVSSFRIFVLPSAEAMRADVRRALLNELLPIYASTGRRFARGLIAPAEVNEYAQLGIEVDQDQSLCWICHRTHLRPFAEHMERLQTQLMARRA
jgi:hypothetical protein